MSKFTCPADPNAVLVMRFFWLFSSFECALKRRGFLKADQYGNAQPDWKKFAETISVPLECNEEFTAARSFLTSGPPQRQVVKNGGLGWESQQRKSGETELAFALRMIRTVRNNLFHGGKYPDPDGPIDGVERNNALIEAAIQVLISCIQMREEFHEFFQDVA